MRSKDDEVEIYKLVKVRDKKSKGLGGVGCIKDEDDKVLMKGKEVRNCRRDNFANFLMRCVTPNL